MNVQLFAQDGSAVVTVQAPANAGAIIYDGRLYVLKDGAFRETVLANTITVLEW